MHKRKFTSILITLTLINIGYSSDIFAPKPLTMILEQLKFQAWTPTPITSIENRSHVVFIDGSGSRVLQVKPSITGELVVGEVNLLENGTGTYGDALRSMFQILDFNTSSLATNDLTGTYTIHPELASYYALDYDDGDLIIRDKSSFYHAEQVSSAYLVFSVQGTPGAATIQASSRYLYDSVLDEYVMDDTWQNHWVFINDEETVTLTDVSTEATEWVIADARELIDVGIESGSGFNPSSTSWQTNSFAAYPIDNNTGELAVWDYDDSPLKTSQFYNNVDDDYQNQLGHSDEASAFTSSVLDVINQNLIDLGQSMRYSKETYIVFREALLNNHFESVDLYNSVLGERMVEHVYFTSSYDDEGAYHPFMVIASHNAPAGPQFLIDVARPPGDGTPGLGYAEQTVTRNSILEQKLIKIPLRDYGLVSNLTDNDLSEFNSLALDENLSESEWTVDNHASTSSTGIAVDGVVVYPASNNVLLYASLAAEITSTGIHVGRGMGFHYHADGHAFNGNGINLYNANDYADRTHPPLIAFVYDGIAIFGKYEDDYISMDGFSFELDEYGGHDHDEYGYHYHAFSEEVQQQNGPDTYSFTQNFLQRGAFKGLINDIPGFLNVNTNQFMDDEIKQYVGGTGTSQLSVQSENRLVASQITVFPSYPNPFNPSTKIRYELKNDDFININIYNIKGDHIKQLVCSNKSSGYHTVQWDATNEIGEGVSAGMYIYTIQAREYRSTKKMVLLK